MHPNLFSWCAKSLNWGIWVWLEALTMHFVIFGSPKSIYCHIEPPTHLYFLTHAWIGVIISPKHFKNVHMRIRDCLGWVGAWLVHLGGIEVSFVHVTCNLKFFLLRLTNWSICNIYMFLTHSYVIKFSNIHFVFTCVCNFVPLLIFFAGFRS